MDEPTENQKGDTTSTGDDGSTSKESPTLTESQAKAREAKARSDALAELGRIRKAADDANKAATAALKRLQEKEDADLAREEEMAKDDPSELSRIRRRRLDVEREAKIAERETKVKGQLERLLQINAKALSKQYNVSEETLVKYAGDDADSMEELAKSYGERAGESRKTRMTESPDNGKTKGGGAGLTREDVEKMSPEEQNKRMKEIASLSF